MAFSDLDQMGSFWYGYLFGVASALLMFASSVAAFYSRLVRLLYSFAGGIRRAKFLRLPSLLRVRSQVEKIVHGMPEILFAAEIAFRSLDRCMPEQKLNLLRFITAIMAQLRAGSPQIIHRTHMPRAPSPPSCCLDGTAGLSARPERL
jgi:hypothetical protein